NLTKMSTAQIIYEQYKVLPKKVQNELIALINKDNDEYVQVYLPSLIAGLNEMKLIREGKLEATSFEDFMKELKDES
ncbi:MAG: hypothetical protein ACK4YV_05770, partial [Emticicia sp.]